MLEIEMTMLVNAGVNFSEPPMYLDLQTGNYQ